MIFQAYFVLFALAIVHFLVLLQAQTEEERKGLALGTGLGECGHTLCGVRSLDV